MTIAESRPLVGVLEWRWGRMVLDGWGLLWRADVPTDGPYRGEKCWQCRSLGLRIWRATEVVLGRGPLRDVDDGLNRVNAHDGRRLPDLVDVRVLGEDDVPVLAEAARADG